MGGPVYRVAGRAGLCIHAGASTLGGRTLWEHLARPSVQQLQLCQLYRLAGGACRWGLGGRCHLAPPPHLRSVALAGGGGCAPGAGRVPKGRFPWAGSAAGKGKGGMDRSDSGLAGQTGLRRQQSGLHPGGLRMHPTRPQALHPLRPQPHPSHPSSRPYPPNTRTPPTPAHSQPCSLSPLPNRTPAQS